MPQTLRALVLGVPGCTERCPMERAASEPVALQLPALWPGVLCAWREALQLGLCYSYMPRGTTAAGVPLGT